MKLICSMFFTFMCLTNAEIDPDMCIGLENNQEKYEHPDDCSKFLVCMDEMPNEGFCATDTYFNLSTGECDLTECPNPTDPTEEPTESPPSTSNPEIEDGISCPTDLPPDTPSFLPSKEYCDRYYLCINAVPNVMYCRNGLHFNNETHQCDFPINANCEVNCSYI